MTEKVTDQTTGDIVIYQTQDGLTQINVKFEDETVWLTQQQNGCIISNFSNKYC